MGDRPSEHLAALFEISRLLAKQNDSSTIFDAIAAAAAGVVGGSASLYRWDETARVLRCVGSRGTDDAPDDLESGQGLSGRAFADRQPLFDEAGRSVAVPLVRGGTAVGVLAARRDGAEPLEEADARVLAILGDEALAVFAAIDALEQRRTLVDQAERLNAAKASFTSMVSHEFRTPLTGIQGFSEMLRDEALTPEEVREYADDINRDAKRLSTMIADLVELDRLEEGQVDLDLEDVDLSETLRDGVAAMARPERVSLALDDPTIVRADRERLGEMVNYLLENAAAYADGDQRIEVTLRKEGDTAHVAVVDHGPGLPPEALERVFDRFARIDASATKFLRGSTLGMIIAHRLASLHGGRLWAESALGAGSTFHLILPLA